jgi:hypothetical protein
MAKSTTAIAPARYLVIYDHIGSHEPHAYYVLVYRTPSPSGLASGAYPELRCVVRGAIRAEHRLAHLQGLPLGRHAALHFELGQP